MMRTLYRREEYWAKNISGGRRAAGSPGFATVDDRLPWERKKRKKKKAAGRGAVKKSESTKAGVLIDIEGFGKMLGVEEVTDRTYS